MEEYRIRTAGRVAFAELAEAIGITSLNVAAAMHAPTGEWVVQYTRDIENVPESELLHAHVYMQTLVRNEDGILERLGEEQDLGEAHEWLGVPPR